MKYSKDIDGIVKMELNNLINMFKSKQLFDILGFNTIIQYISI